MVQIYVEKLIQKADYRHALIESKDRWKTMDIDERRAMRSELATQHAQE